MDVNATTDFNLWASQRVPSTASTGEQRPMSLFKT